MYVNPFLSQCNVMLYVNLRIFYFPIKRKVCIVMTSTTYYSIHFENVLPCCPREYLAIAKKISSLELCILMWHCQLIFWNSTYLRSHISQPVSFWDYFKFAYSGTKESSEHSFRVCLSAFASKLTRTEREFFDSLLKHAI